MKFRVIRTSDWMYKDAPCEGAVIDHVNKYGDNVWTIEIADLTALLDLCAKEVTSVVVSGPCGVSDNLPTIEIYDDYRE